jgi:hypothetical protein
MSNETPFDKIVNLIKHENEADPTYTPMKTVTDLLWIICCVAHKCRGGDDWGKSLSYIMDIAIFNYTQYQREMNEKNNN